ncbi:hypothetical protein D7027_05305 [Ochrobactrum intermedium]|uniref:hypothetical protein n=1 Tax=Brucella intermedia TaxID=94625 RepID=UPI00128D5A6D|nr:hypothetical protein [Brucella intermedia]MPR61237.1 hypothetical protein [Brucella intermedia]
MDINEQRLFVSLELKANQLQRELDRMQRKTSGSMSAMEGRTKRAAANMEKSMSGMAAGIQSKLSAAFAPLMAGGAVAAVATGFKQIASTVAEVSREADKARVSTKVWQQWTYVAKATGASIDGVTDALKELNIRGDEFATTGKGSAQAAFERLGYTAADVAQALRDPSAFLDEIIGKVQKLDQAAQTRIVDEIWGGTGAEEMSKMLGLSVEQIQKLRSEAALFTDDQLKAAKEIDREWETLWRNVQVYAKQAALESVGAVEKVISTLRRLKGDNIVATSRNYALSDEGRLNAYLERRADLLERIADLRRQPDFDEAIDGLALERLEADLAAVESQIASLTPHSKEFAAALKELSNITLGTSSNFNSTAASAANFKQALNDLKGLVPELKAEMDELAKLDTIDQKFQQMVKNAKTPADIETANRIAERARTVAKYGDHKNLLDLIGAAEGTDKGRGYNETLAYGRFSGGNRNLTSMTLNEVLALQKQMLAHPENTYNSSAVGRYQITAQTLRDFMPRLGLAGDSLFDEKTQDALAQAIAATTGGNIEKLRGRWEGLRHVDAGSIQSAYGGTQTIPDKLPLSKSQQDAAEATERQAEARKRLNESLRESQSYAELERRSVGMSVQQRETEFEVFRRIQEMKRQGVNLSDTEIQKIRDQVTATQQLETGTARLIEAQESAKQAKEFFASSFTSSLSGLITGTTSLTDSVRNLANALADAALQGLLLGKGPLAAMFGYGVSGGPSGLLGSIFGFADGGYTGRGGKYEPAGVVHRGEYVMSAAATKKLGVGNLERLHESAKRGYANGGLVGASKLASGMAPLAAREPSQTVSIAPTINVNANGGTHEQNSDLAKQISKQVEKSLSGMVAQEISRQQRPGNMIGRRFA